MSKPQTSTDNRVTPNRAAQKKEAEVWAEVRKNLAAKKKARKTS